MVKYLGLKLARKPNMFPAKHRVSKYYIPRMIVCQENGDYEKHLKINFGTYVLVKNKTNPQIRMLQEVCTAFIYELQIALKEVTRSYTCRLTPSLCTIALHPL